MGSSEMSILHALIFHLRLMPRSETLNVASRRRRVMSVTLSDEILRGQMLHGGEAQFTETALRDGITSSSPSLTTVLAGSLFRMRMFSGVVLNMLATVSKVSPRSMR